jgi:hypothetical protein
LGPRSQRQDGLRFQTLKSRCTRLSTAELRQTGSCGFSRGLSFRLRSVRVSRITSIGLVSGSTSRALLADTWPRTAAQRVESGLVRLRLAAAMRGTLCRPAPRAAARRVPKPNAVNTIRIEKDDSPDRRSGHATWEPGFHWRPECCPTGPPYAAGTEEIRDFHHHRHSFTRPLLPMPSIGIMAPERTPQGHSVMREEDERNAHQGVSQVGAAATPPGVETPSVRCQAPHNRRPALAANAECGFDQGCVNGTADLLRCVCVLYPPFRKAVFACFD